jgi:C_GCAxxG_C_C family probable redox protein
MTDPRPNARIRELFLLDEGYYGCAEVTQIALQEQFGLPEPGDSSPAMVLNGGLAYSGGACGAVTGASLAVGRLAEARLSDHRDAKRTARHVIQGLMVEFEDEFGSMNCRDLTGYDMMKDHEAFIEDGRWKTECTRQIEFVAERLQALMDQEHWDGVVEAATGPAEPIKEAGEPT